VVLATARNVGWVVGLLWRFLRWISNENDTPVFGMEWRFYDSTPTTTNAVGRAVFSRSWRWSVQGKWIRTKERNPPHGDINRTYVGSGYLRDRKMVLHWVAEDRPNTFGALVLAVDEDCKEMKGYTVYTPQNTGTTIALDIWFKR
jgi:hypothetical protein